MMMHEVMPAKLGIVLRVHIDSNIGEVGMEVEVEDLDIVGKGDKEGLLHSRLGKRGILL